MLAASMLSSAPAAMAATAEVVLLIPGGNGQGGPDFASMADYLRTRGFRPLVINFPQPLDLHNPLGAQRYVRDDANYLANQIDALKRNGVDKVDLVGHSMGGLAARWYLKKLGGTSNVRTYIAFGTPQHGSTVGCLLVPDQCPSGDVQQEINEGDDTPDSTTSTEDDNAHHIPYTSIGSLDEPVEADGSLTRLDGGAYLPLVHGGLHGSEPGDPTIQAAVLQALEHRNRTQDFTNLSPRSP